MPKPFNQNAAIRGAIRRIFARSPLVREVLMAGRREVPKHNKDGSRAKRDAVQYQCEVCTNWVSSTKVSVDHKEPVVSVDTGFVDWNDFIARLWCDKTNLQRCCDDCHKKKTAQERFTRTFKAELATVALFESCPGPTLKKFVSKFNRKRFEQFPYPVEFRARINKLRVSFGLREV